MRLARRGNAPTRAARSTASTVVLALLGTLLTVTSILVPAESAQAATVTIGTIQGQMADHKGADNGTGGDNCITYNPTNTATSSGLVSNPNEAQTGHGFSGSRCPNKLSTTDQSVVGFRPSATTSAQDGVSFLIGRMIHYNNPITASDRYFTGTINTVLGGFTAPNTLSFPWSLDETPNTGGGVNDVITFTNQISTVTLTQGGLSFRLVVLGFIPVANATTCPTTPAGTPVNEFSTVEGQQTHACLYASLQQTRTLTISKVVTGFGAPTRTFGFTSTSTLAGSPWTNSTWNLSAGGSQKRDLTSGNAVTVTENDPNDDRWELTGLTCKQYAADGTTLVDVPGATLNPAARQVVLNTVPAPLSASNPGITCTYTNTYTPKATLTLVKQVQ
ncbi:MAG: choice-of-anchor K domain-containing protein, partial [Dermatophilaceae bacterium]